MGKIFANYVPNKDLVSMIHKEFLQLNKILNDPVKKKAEGLKRYLFKKIYINGQQAHEKILSIINY